MLTTLGAKNGTEVTLTVSGEDEEEVFTAWWHVQKPFLWGLEVEQMHKTGNVVVEGVAIGKIQFLNADYEEQIKRYMTGTEEEEKKRYQEAHTLAKMI